MITVDHVSKSFGATPVLMDLTFSIPTGRITTLMGPSGSGKTTLANILMNLVPADTGAVLGLAGCRLSAVFQDDRLCEHLDAVENVRLILRRGGRRADVLGELSLVGLDGESVSKPVSQLSGGQRRRVALVRAMVADSDFICLDEPFNGLDEATRNLAMAYVKARRRGRTILLITHDRHEAFLSDYPPIELSRPGPASDGQSPGAQPARR